MIKVQIAETKEIKTLNIIGSNGVSWISDLLGNHDVDLTRDDETDAIMMDNDTYEWWHDLTLRLQEAEDALRDMEQEIDTYCPEYQDKKNLTLAVDLENLPEAIMELIEEVGTNKGQQK